MLFMDLLWTSMVFKDFLRLFWLEVVAEAEIVEEASGLLKLCFFSEGLECELSPFDLGYFTEALELLDSVFFLGMFEMLKF